MPNWCQNRLVIEHEFSAQIQKICDVVAKDEGLLNHLLPMPDEIFRGPLGGKELEPLNSSGIPTWYDCSIKNWGTKWEVTNITAQKKSEKKLLLHFQSAWSPPLPMCKALIERGFSVEFHYIEYGMNFGGFFRGSGDAVDEKFFDDLSKSLTSELEQVFEVSSYLEWLNASSTKH